LGFCGPQEEARRQALYGFVVGEDSREDGARKTLEGFEAMYPYLSLIASENGIFDPFEERVVEALWVGNELLDGVDAESLKKLILTDFVRPKLLTQEEAKERSSRVVSGMVPHHSFHVLVLGSITGRVDLGGALRELCRVGWGEVLGVGGDKIKVRFRPLSFEKLNLGEEREKEVDWDPRTVPGVSAGDWASFHWGRVCDVLKKENVANLEKYTVRTLSVLSR